MRRTWAAAIAVLVLLMAGLFASWPWNEGEPAEGLVIRGGDGVSMPVASADTLGLDPAALQVARATAERAGASGLLIARRGHRVEDPAALLPAGRVRAGLLSRMVMAAGLAAHAEQGGTAAQDPGRAGDWLSAALWQPLSASDAVLESAAGRPLLESGLWLQSFDALAVATALARGGEVGGVRLLSAAAAAQVLSSLEDGQAPRGAEPFGARAARLLRDAEGTRLYFFPVQELVILLIGADERRLLDETELAHQVLRGIVDATPAPAADPADLVPHH